MDSVLIVDDNEDLLDVLAEVVLSAGRLCVHKARSGLEALRLYEALAPSLVILDEGLGDMRGSDLLQRLRATCTRASRPALFVTGARKSVQCLPGDIVLEKPVGIESLLDAVRALVPQAG
jgi:DNA-binding response OmpR family regulator